MYSQRKIAKNYLNKATLSDFWDIVREAKITKENQKILDERFVDGLSITQIAQKENCSEEKVKKIITQSYDRVYKLLNG